MSELFSWFVGVTREFASGLGHQPTSVDAGRGGEVPNALPPSKFAECGEFAEQEQNKAARDGLRFTQTPLRYDAPPLSNEHSAIQEHPKEADILGRSVSAAPVRVHEGTAIISIERGVQRVMDAHNYAGSGMSRARFDAEVQAGVERMHEAEEENQLEEQ